MQAEEALTAWPAVGELVLGKVPDALVGIELGGVGGKRDKAEPAVAATESLDRISAGREWGQS